MQDRNDNNSGRRRFLTRSVAGLAAVGLPEWFAREEASAAVQSPPRKRFGPNDQIQVGGIGMGGSRGGYRQGLGDTRAASRQSGCKVVAVCDVDRVHLDESVKEFGPDTKGYTYYRTLLEQPDIDAVVIGSPDHWHATMAIDAMKSGKDVYCEKPLALTIYEGRQIADTARKAGAVFQTGSQQRSDGRFRLACELVRNGRLGEIKRVEARLPGAPAGGPFPVALVPGDLNWDLWLGPAPKVEYIKERTHGSFRYWREYSGGMMTDWGAHHLDITQWALGMDDSGPVAVEAQGTTPTYEPHSFNVSTAFDVTYTYPNGVTVVATNKGENGIRFEGETGWLFVSRDRIEASDKAILDDPLPENAIRLYKSDNHMGNFIACVRDRKAPVCTAEIGHRSATVCHLGNIALRLPGKPLRWDPKRETFVGENQGDANPLRRTAMREPWAV
ncbi:MAG: Gfo/Idh/MocA family oxidoreductase [Akkermansiaceae bacterium]|nr:Gfo/Idh/MocA family oxidoreductase [Armatimonadota bacterium]